MKQHKLLHQTLRYYIGFGLLIALLIAPVFYLLIKKFQLHEMDEYLYLQMEKTVEKSIKTLTINEINDWNHFNSENKILFNSEQINTINYKTESVYNEIEQEYEPYRVIYAPIEIEGKNFILTIQISIVESQKILQSSVILQLLLFLCLIVGMIVITRVIHRRLFNPFYRTLLLIEHFNIRQHELLQFPITDVKEFNQLNIAIEKLMDDNLQAYKIQKEFTENASHEMQTPLAVFRSKLDMLLQQPTLNEEQSVIIQTLHETISRLVRMNNNLLLLAKMDNGQIPDSLQTIDVCATVKKTLSILKGQAEASNITIEMRSDEPEISVFANQQLFECLVNNLLTNAVRHNTPGGKIHIMLTPDSFTISNTGNDIPLDTNLLFRRFGRMNPAAKGSGLGLAIVRQICSLYGWQITYIFKSGMYRFEVNF